MRTNAQAIINAIRHKRKNNSPIGVMSDYMKDAAGGLDSGLSGMRDIEGIATCEKVDAVGDVVIATGADTRYLDTNLNIFADHRYEMEDGVAALRWKKLVRTIDGAIGWKIRVTVKKRPKQLCEVALESAQLGVLALSIGFEPLDWGDPTAAELLQWPGAKTIIRRWAWHETSFTLRPCLVSCRAGMAETDDSKQALVEDLITKSRLSPSARVFMPNLLELPEPAMPERRKTLLIV